MNAQTSYNPVTHETFKPPNLISPKYQKDCTSHSLTGATLGSVSTPVDPDLGLSPTSNNACSRVGAQFEQQQQQQQPPKIVHTYQLVITHDEHGSHTKFEPKLSVRDAQLLARTIRSKAARSTSIAQLGEAREARCYNHTELDQGTVRLKRTRAPTPPPTPQSSIGHTRFNRRFQASIDTGLKSKDVDEPIESYLDEDKIDITDEKAVTELLECLFDILHQGICRSLAKVIIKAIEPDKQSAHPYRREAQKAVLKLRSDAGIDDPPRPTRTSEWSAWWPDEVIYKGERIPMLFIEPDHLHKSCRVSLLIHMLRLPHTSKEYYENMCRQDATLHGERSWSNWAEWLSRRIDQIELGEKPSRRNRNGLDVNKVRDANELKSARKKVLKIIFNIIASEETFLDNPSEVVTKHVKFKIPPLLLKAYRKFQFETKQASQSPVQQSYQGHVQFEAVNPDSPPNKRRLLNSAERRENPKQSHEISPASGAESSRCSTEELTDAHLGNVKHSSICLAQAVSSPECLNIQDLAWRKSGRNSLNQSFISVDSGYDSSPHKIFSVDQNDEQFHFGQPMNFDCNKAWETSAAQIAVGLNGPVTVFDHQSTQWRSNFPALIYGTSGVTLGPPISPAPDLSHTHNNIFIEGSTESNPNLRSELYGGLCGYDSTTISPAMTNVPYTTAV